MSFFVHRCYYPHFGTWVTWILLWAQAVWPVFVFFSTADHHLLCADYVHWYYRLIASPVVTKCCQRADFWFAEIIAPHPTRAPQWLANCLYVAAVNSSKTCFSSVHVISPLAVSHPTNSRWWNKMPPSAQFTFQKTSDDEIRAGPAWLSDIAICCHS